MTKMEPIARTETGKPWSVPKEQDVTYLREPVFIAKQMNKSARKAITASIVTHVLVKMAFVITAKLALVNVSNAMMDIQVKTVTNA